MAAAAAIVLTFATARPLLRTVAFLMDIAGDNSMLRRMLPAARSPVSTAEVPLPTRHGPMPVRIYRPARASSQTAIVFPGVHGGGVDEPRLALFADRLAATGVTVVSAPLPELREFQITSRSTDMIEDAIRWVARDHELAPRGRVAVVAVSFGGGLALVAGGRAAVRSRIDGIVAIGGYGDLERVLRYLCTGVAADGVMRPPHTYGLAVVTLAAVPFIAPADQRSRLTAGIRTFLEASLDESPDQQRAARLLGEAERMAATLPAPSHAILQQVIDHDVVSLGETIQPFIGRLAADPALSPERSPAPMAPVFLLHGEEDNIIPADETPRLAAYLQQEGNRRVRWLQTPLISHAAIEPGMDLGAAWKFVRFWQDTRRVLQ